MGAAWERWRRRNVSACGGTISRMDDVTIIDAIVSSRGCGLSLAQLQGTYFEKN